MDETEVKHNRPVAGMKAHLFDESEVEKATLVAGRTDEPVRSLCGSVRSYGDFTGGVPEDGETCANCMRLLETDEDE